MRVYSKRKYISVIISVLVYILCVQLCEGAVNYSNLNQTFSNDINPEFVITEDSYLTTPELIKKYGYPIETYEDVITEDGHVLTLHRIPYGRDTGPSENRPVVYVQAGFVSNSVDAVLTGPDKALGYYLADKGYDVWLGNTRGSRYARKHLRTSRKSRKYWDYSFSEIGLYDVPAMVDYIINVTKVEKIFYIGHSRGTTAFFIMCADKPEYNNKFRAMAAMAPISYMSHVPNPLFHIAAYNLQLIKSLLNALNIYYVDLDHRNLIDVCRNSRSITILQPNICTLMLFSLGGFDLQNFNVSILPLFLGHLPDGFAIKEFEHFGQNILTGKFRHFDYGPSINMQKYNKIEPPDIDLSKITVPISIYYSTNDLQSSAVDAEILAKELKNLDGMYLMEQGPNHFSYFNGMNARRDIYDKILEMFSKY